MIDINFGAGASAEASGITLQADGKIVAAGPVRVGSSEDVAIVRYTAAGVADTTFGRSGRRLINFDKVPSAERSGAVVMQTIGGTQKIVVTSASTTNPDGDATVDVGVARLNLDGTLDTSFSGDGKVLTTTSYPIHRVPGLAIQNLSGPYASNIVTASVTLSSNLNLDDRLIITRYDGNSLGTLDNVWVNDDWTITSDVGPAGHSTGDIVTTGSTVGVFGIDAFSSIQAAINAVDAGGSVHVFNGTYTEQVEISKALTIDGESTAGTVIKSPATLALSSSPPPRSTSRSCTCTIPTA